MSTMRGMRKRTDKQMRPLRRFQHPPPLPLPPRWPAPHGWHPQPPPNMWQPRHHWQNPNHWRPQYYQPPQVRWNGNFPGHHWQFQRPAYYQDARCQQPPAQYVHQPPASAVKTLDVAEVSSSPVDSTLGDSSDQEHQYRCIPLVHGFQDHMHSHPPQVNNYDYPLLYFKNEQIDGNNNSSYSYNYNSSIPTTASCDLKRTEFVSEMEAERQFVAGGEFIPSEQSEQDMNQGQSEQFPSSEDGVNSPCFQLQSYENSGGVEPASVSNFEEELPPALAYPESQQYPRQDEMEQTGAYCAGNGVYGHFTASAPMLQYTAQHQTFQIPNCAQVLPLMVVVQPAPYTYTNPFARERNQCSASCPILPLVFCGCHQKEQLTKRPQTEQEIEENKLCHLFDVAMEEVRVPDNTNNRLEDDIPHSAISDDVQFQEIVTEDRPYSENKNRYEILNRRSEVSLELIKPKKLIDKFKEDDRTMSNTKLQCPLPVNRVVSADVDVTGNTGTSKLDCISPNKRKASDDGKKSQSAKSNRTIQHFRTNPRNQKPRVPEPFIIRENSFPIHPKIIVHTAETSSSSMSTCSSLVPDKPMDRRAPKRNSGSKAKTGRFGRVGTDTPKKPCTNNTEEDRVENKPQNNIMKCPLSRLYLKDCDWVGSYNLRSLHMESNHAHDLVMGTNVSLTKNTFKVLKAYEEIFICYSSLHPVKRKLCCVVHHACAKHACDVCASRFQYTCNIISDDNLQNYKETRIVAPIYETLRNLVQHGKCVTMDGRVFRSLSSRTPCIDFTISPP